MPLGDSNNPKFGDTKCRQIACCPYYSFVIGEIGLRFNQDSFDRSHFSITSNGSITVNNQKQQINLPLHHWKHPKDTKPSPSPHPPPILYFIVCLLYFLLSLQRLMHFCLQLLMFLFADKEKQAQQPKPRFKEITPLEMRITLRQKFQEKYPKERYALVVLQGVDELEPSLKSFSILGIESHFTILMLLEYIRQKILRADNQQSFFLKIRSQIRRTSDNLGELFKHFAEEDGFLYIEIKKESIF